MLCPNSSPRNHKPLSSPSATSPLSSNVQTTTITICPQSSWSFSVSASNAHTTGSLSSLLNPTASSTSLASGYSSSSRPPPATINTYTSSYALLSRGHHSAGSVSPDSRPTSSYSASSMSTLPTRYEDQSAHFSHDYSRLGSGHHRPLSLSSSPPPSPKSYANGGSLSIRRKRRHSQVMSPYPSPYSEHPSQKDHAGSGAIPRVRSMIQLPSVDSCRFNPAQGDFTYAVDKQQSHSTGVHGVPGTRTVRPSWKEMPT
ncbi:hypothetical protein LXA43DRAFT_1135463 [Ganoderma leucocontextum]|nr:hypothetical protein LXA43DRAFT_1135463 [Ganoderma leucocontextum]